MSEHYLKNKAAKESFLMKGTVVLIVLAIIFIVFMARFALSYSKTDMLNTAPNSDIAYSIAKQLIRPTIKSHKVSFQEAGYQCAQKSDSVFIIKSYAESRDEQGPKSITTFEVSLKYLGGEISDKNNWKVLNLNEN